MGIILNRPSRVSLKETLPDLEGLNLPEGKVGYGGPVKLEMIVLAVRTPEELPGTFRVFKTRCAWG